MLETTIEKELHEKLIEFAENNEKIKALFKGTSPECPYEGRIVYYFITKDICYDDKLQDEIINLDLKLHRGLLLNRESVGLMVWPIEPEEAEDDFVGECIYRKVDL